MKIKLDENLPQRLAATLSKAGHDVDTVSQEGLQGKKDPAVWQASQAAARFFITQDLDFSDERLFAPGTHHGILVLRLRDPGRNALLHRVLTLFASEDVAQWPGCFVIATDHKIRVRHASK